MTPISDAKVGEWLERASKWRGNTGMVADAIRLIERMIAENRALRKRLEVQDDDS